MKVVNLTIPLYPFFPVGSTFPWDAPFRTEDITSYERNAARLTFISMGGDSGTRLMGAGLFSSDAPKLESLPLDTLVNKKTRVLSIPKGAREAIDADEVNRAFSQAADLAMGNAVLIATGWGDGQRWKILGERFALESPYFTRPAADCLLDYLARYRTNLLLTDCAYLDHLGAQFVRKDWIKAPAWQRPGWPSDQAQGYLRQYTADQALADWAVTRRILAHTWAIAGLANCGALPAKQVRITCLPMFVQGAGEAPCTVVAEY